MLKMRDLKNSFSAIDKALEERNVEDYDIFNIIILSDEIDVYYIDKETGDVDSIVIIKDNVTNTKLEDFKWE